MTNEQIQAKIQELKKSIPAKTEFQKVKYMNYTADEKFIFESELGGERIELRITIGESGDQLEYYNKKQEEWIFIRWI